MKTVRSPRHIAWVSVIFVVAGVLALAVGDRMLTRWAYAVESGRIQANSEGLAGLREISNGFRMVAKVARPGVVHIRVEGIRAAGNDESLEREKEMFRRRLGDEFTEELWDRFKQQYLHRDAPPATGSGIIFDSDGYILTNNHVVANREQIEVRMNDGRRRPATVIGNDPKTDLAVIKVNEKDLHPLKFGDSDLTEVGDWVLAVGAPFGLTQTVTHGIISATGRNQVATAAPIMYQNFLQTDAAINPGNSGGPLLNLKGEVIGVNTAIATNGDAYNAGIAFTIPSNMALEVARQLRDQGEVERGWLGISLSVPDPDERLPLGVEGRDGVLVNVVYSGSPADKAGLQVEDFITKVDGVEVENVAQLQAAIADVFPGEATRLEIIRDGKPREIVVHVGRQPDDVRSAVSGARPIVGRPVRELSVQVRTVQRGLLLAEIGSDSPLEAQPGDFITAVDGRPVDTVQELRDAIERQRGVVEIELESRNGRVRTVDVRLD